MSEPAFSVEFDEPHNGEYFLITSTVGPASLDEITEALLNWADDDRTSMTIDAARTFVDDVESRRRNAV